MALPTRDQMIANALDQLRQAFDALNASADWLRSDWQPLGSALTQEQSDLRQRMTKAITAAKREINKVLDTV